MNGVKRIKVREDYKVFIEFGNSLGDFREFRISRMVVMEFRL